MIDYEARSSRGLGYLLFKQKIRGSNPLRAVRLFPRQARESLTAISANHGLEGKVDEKADKNKA